MLMQSLETIGSTDTMSHPESRKVGILMLTLIALLLALIGGLGAGSGRIGSEDTRGYLQEPSWRLGILTRPKYERTTRGFCTSKSRINFCQRVCKRWIRQRPAHDARG